MSEDAIRKKLINADRIITVLDKKGKFRASIIRNSNSTLLAQSKHELNMNSAKILAEHLTAASLVASFLKGEERILIDTSGDGMIKNVFSEAMPIGEVRGFINPKNIPVEPGNEFIGNGLFKLSRILYDNGEPVAGIIEIKSYLTEENVEKYFRISEQVPTFIKLDVDFDKGGNISYSSGVIIQSLPGAKDFEIHKVEQTLKNASSINVSIAEESDLRQILSSFVPFDYDIIKSSRIDFFCRCSKNNFINKLYTLPVEEIEAMKNECHNELVCQFCNAHYYLDELDFARIIQDMKAKKN